MIHWFPFLVLAFAAYRATRLVGWDDPPPVVAARDWLLGRHVMGEKEWEEAGSPDFDPDTGPVAYQRPTLAHFVKCPFCLGAWVSLTVYGCWLAEPRWTLYAAVPFALSAAVGLVAKNWDP